MPNQVAHLVASCVASFVGSHASFAKIVFDPRSKQLDDALAADRRQALSYPDAERRDAARDGGASHLVDQRRMNEPGSDLTNFTFRGRSLIGVYNGKLGPPFPLSSTQVPIPLPGKRKRLHFKHA